MAPSKLSPDQWAAVVKRLKDGAKHSVVADKFGISESTLSHYIKRHGLQKDCPRSVSTHGRRVPAAVEARVVKLLRKKMTYYDIADKVGFAPSAISRIATKHGISHKRGRPRNE